MGTINLIAKFIGKDIETGMQRMVGQAKRLGADMENGFSPGNIARNFISGFMGVDLVRKVVEPFKQAAVYADRVANAVAGLRDVSLAGIIGRNTPERNIQTISGEIKGNDARLASITAKLAELPDFSDPNFIKNIYKNPQMVNPFVYEARKGEYDSLIAERDDINAKNQALVNQRNDLERNTAVSRRQVDYQTAGIMDQRSVRRGDMSQVAALEKAQQRATEEYMKILTTRGPGVETQQAYNAMLQAQDATRAATVAFDKDRIQGVLPQISSSSLAQLGGGGNVNVFGGRAGEGLSELKEQTRLLRAIETKIAGNSVTLDPR